MNDKPLVVQMKINGGEGGIIPSGVTETLKIEIVDNAAAFHFLDCKITKAFAVTQNTDGVKSMYNERLKKTLCRYPNMSKEEIAKHLVERLKVLQNG